MTPDDIPFIKAVIIAVFLAGTGLATYWLRLRYRQVVDSSLRQELEALRDELAALRQSADGRLAELEDRVDFAERRLTQGHDLAARPIVRGGPSLAVPATV